jgi:hypothetical protein
MDLQETKAFLNLYGELVGTTLSDEQQSLLAEQF